MTAPSRRAKLDVNSAPVEALAQVPGLDAELAVRLAALRPFKHTKEILRVPGLDFALFEQAAPYLKVARSRPATAKPDQPRRRSRPAAPAPAPAPAPIPVQVHVHVNAASGEATTYRTAGPAPAPPPEVVEPVIIAEPAGPRRAQSLAPRPALAVMPVGRQVSAALFESYAGPRLVFALFSVTLAAAALAFATGQISWKAAAAPPDPAAQIGQAVAATLTALPTELPPTAPPAPPTVTPPPTATSAPAAPTPTLAFVSSSGLEGVGEQIFNETFVPADYWSVGETDFSRIAVEEGWLRVLIKTPGSLAWAVNGYAAQNFYYQGLMQIGTCQLGDYAGLVFRATNEGNLYLFGLSCDGRYRLVRRLNGEFQVLLDFTFTSEASAGSNAVNLLAVRAAGRELRLYVNDQQVGVYTETAEIEPVQGFFGAFAKASNTADLLASFDDVSAWNLKP